MNMVEVQRRFEELASLIDGARMLIESHEESGLSSALHILEVVINKAMDAAEDAAEAQTCPEDQPV
ncbi:MULTISPECIES: hypothetical protein [unclassified Thiomonas]|uniref:hypothetical protein n=1 Tax=unclassified Thiomonas TaxID=2625466 RepID=UPI0004DBB950|nr:MULTISPECIES: hypothetical protein [unclassified Thiomonas]CDW92228.1 hypothetical protein THICB2_10012 [Thiomonas sp. CB2]VDY06616.1 protein of unknown function [Thiomonas sp. Bio17B3]VDY10088.1 protein of unknown function [Thiomonas sp. Sup16B3]VDY14888.1 conserved protein of unknown function [Thiomonas sp. OC7]VDY15933.1 protein of unknown function [Thiomonas sp. CB2]